MKGLKLTLIILSAIVMLWAVIGLIFIWMPLKYVAEQAPDCEVAGHITYYQDWFGRCYLDKAGTIQIDISEIFDLSSDIYSESWEDGKTLKDKYAPLGHSLTKVDAIAATCVQDGAKEYYFCEQCHAKFTDRTCTAKFENGAEIVPKLNHLGDLRFRCKYVGNGEHQYFCERADCPGTTKEDCAGDWSKPFDCTIEGNISRQCEKCGNVETKPSQVFAGHDWGAWQVEIPASCTLAGSKIRTCNNCSCTEEGDIPATGHSFGHSAVTRAATCIAEGETTYYCGVCGVGYEKHPISATGIHTWDNGEVTQSPTCTSKGTKTYKCTVCGLSRTEDMATLNHTPDSGHITREPSCTQEGEKTYNCAVCGKTLKTEAIEKREHSYGAGQITRDPTCALEGEKTFSCAVCGNIKREPIDKLPHTYTISDEYWNEPQFEPSTPSRPAKIQYSCGECKQQFVSVYSQELFISLGLNDKIMPEDKFTSDTVVMFDAKQHCLAINLSQQSSALNGLGEYQDIFDMATRVLKIPAAYGVRSDQVKSVRVIGTAAPLGEFSITSAKLNELTLTLKNISFTAKNGVGLDLGNVANAKLEIIGNVTIVATDGKDGVVAQNLTVVGGDALTVRGGKGANGNSSAGADGGNGISAQTLTSRFEGAMSVSGGNGGDGSGNKTAQTGANGFAGGNGGAGVFASTITVECGDISLFGGDGGRGGDGSQGVAGTSYGSGADEDWWDHSPNGGNGGRGGKGGSGGKAGDAVCVESLMTIVDGNVCATGGRGGAGGNGGNGGDGGKGGDADAMGVFGGKGGDGGKGGNGGDGGDAFTGGNAINGNFEDNTQNAKLQQGANGAGGLGGAKGKGGAGGGNSQNWLGAQNGNPGALGDSDGAPGTLKTN